MKVKYTVDGYFENREIGRIYEYYGWNYSSELSSCIELKNKVLKSINEEKLLVRARKYAKDETKDAINYVLNKITRMLDECIEQAQNDDNRSIELVKNKYAEFVIDADRKVKDGYDNAIKNRENKYQSLIVDYNEAEKSSQMESVKRSFEYMNGYSDSVAYIQKCNEKIEQFRKAEEAEKVRLKAQAKRELVIKSVAAISVFIIVIAVIIVVKKVIIPSNNYNKAVALMENDQYEEAMAAFEELDGYKDSDEMYQKCIDDYQEYLFKKEIDTIIDANVGDTVAFGDYYSNTEWIVLDEKDNKKLLLSKCAVDRVAYNTTYEAVTWETSSIRNWMNTTYMDIAFSESEKQKIATTTVKNSSSDSESAEENDAEDSIFLLSIEEVKKYLLTDKARIAYLTNGEISSWWLRSQGKMGNFAAFVSTNGDLVSTGTNVNGKKAVRPAMWIDLSDY